MLKNNLILMVFLLVIFIFLQQWSIRAFSAQEMQTYDKTGELLQAAYAGTGLVPYRDFWSSYPPGNMIFASMFGFTTLERENMMTYSLFLAVCTGITLMICLFRVSAARCEISISAFLLLSIVLLDKQPIVDLLSGLLLVTVIYSLHKKKATHADFLLFFLPFFIIFFRWDRIFLFLIVEIVCFAPFIYRYWKRRRTRQMHVLILLLLLQVTGFFLGALSLAYYFSQHGGLRNGLELTYFIPSFVIYPYRDLPLPQLLAFPGILFFITWFSVGAFALMETIRLWRNRKNTDGFQLLSSLLLCLSPCMALPYALGRSDRTHIHPMLFLTGLSICIGFLFFPKKKALVLLFVLTIMIALAFWMSSVFVLAPKPYFSMTKLLAAKLEDCKSKTNQYLYGSLFVGRTSYERYFINGVALYFLNTSIPPATRFFSEEPGVQNSCEYGERIVQELRTAPKPMVVFITDQKVTRYEENKTREMKSCGKIEQYLMYNPYKVLGTCISYDIPYEIRIYE